MVLTVYSFLNFRDKFVFEGASLVKKPGVDYSKGCKPVVEGCACSVSISFDC